MGKLDSGVHFGLWCCARRMGYKQMTRHELLHKEQRAHDRLHTAAHRAEVRRYKQYTQWSRKSQARLETFGKRVGYDDPRYLRALHRHQAEGAKRYVPSP